MKGQMQCIVATCPLHDLKSLYLLEESLVKFRISRKSYEKDGDRTRDKR